MAEHRQLTDTLRTIWQGAEAAGVFVDDQLRLCWRAGEVDVVGPVLFVEIEVGREYALALLGPALWVSLKLEAGEPPRAVVKGELVDSRSLPLLVSVEGEALHLDWTEKPAGLSLLQGRVQVSPEAFTVRLTVSPDGVELGLLSPAEVPESTLRLGFDVLGRGHGRADTGLGDFTFQLPFADTAGTSPYSIPLKCGKKELVGLARWVAAPLAADVEDWTAPVLRWRDVLARRARETISRTSASLRGDVDRLFGGLSELGDLDRLPEGLLAGSELKLELREEHLVISGLQLTFETGEADLVLTKGEMTLDHDLTLDPDSGIRFELRSDYAFLASSKAPFTCVLRKQTGVRLRLGTEGWSLSAEADEGMSVGAIAVPGIARWQDLLAPEESAEVRQRFVMDLVPTEDGIFSLDERGVVLSAIARERGVDIGGTGAYLESGAVVGGRIDVRHGDWSLEIRGAAKLPWFEGSRGDLSVRGGRRQDGYHFGAEFEVTVHEGWTDPSGVISVRNPSVGVTLAWSKDGGWDVGGYVGGSLVFNRVPLLGDAARWVNEIFDELSIDFERTDLRRFGTLKAGLRLALRRPPRVRLWDVFELDLRGISISTAAKITFDADVSFDLGAVRFAGSLPALGLRLNRRGVGLETSSPTHFRGSLQAPSGVRVDMAFSRHEGDHSEDVLMGSGSITAPTIPDVAVMVTVGRFETSGRHKPTIAVFASAPVNIPVFVGVVLKRVGVGFGVYRSLRGANQVGSAKDAFALLSSGKLPVPGEAESWVLDPSTPFSLVAQTQIASTTAPHGSIDYYVGDLVLSLDARLRLAAFGHMWMLTRPTDALRSEFHDRPYARGVLVVDPTRPSVVGAYESLPRPKSSLTADAGVLGEAVGGLLGLRRTRASFEARDGLFDLTLGPDRTSFRLGPFHAQSTTLIGFRGSSAGVHALASMDLSAGFSAEFPLDMGLVRAGVSGSADFSAQALLYGHLTKDSLLLAADAQVSARASVSVWLEIRFYMRIKVGWIKITISFSKRWSAGFSIQATAKVALALRAGSEAGVAFAGEVGVAVRLAGIRVAGTLQVGNREAALLVEARQAANAARRGHLLAGG